MGDNVNPAENAGNENAEAAENANPQEQQSAENANGESEETNSQSEPSENNKQEHDWKGRFDKTSQAHKQLSEKHDRVIDTNVKLVEKNPAMLEDLAETDPDLADEVSKKLHGKSYEDFKKDEELAELKKTDPERYEQEKRLRTLEKQNAKQVQDSIDSFLKDNGIKNNPFDPDYKKIKAELNTFNPQYVEENPVEAWRRAHALAFPGGSNSEDNKKDADLAKNTNSKGGLSTKMEHGQSGKNPDAEAFRNQMSNLLGT